MRIIRSFTDEQIDHYRSLTDQFADVAGRHGWSDRYCENMAAKCVKFGLETIDRFPLITLALFNGNTNIIHTNSRIIFKAMTENGVAFAAPVGDAEWSNYTFDSYFDNWRAPLEKAAESVLEKQHANDIAIRLAQRGLESPERVSRVNRAFFDAVLNTQSRMAGDLVARVLATKGFKFHTS